jgi:hypothetical protein
VTFPASSERRALFCLFYCQKEARGMGEEGRYLSRSYASEDIMNCRGGVCIRLRVFRC